MSDAFIRFLFLLVALVVLPGCQGCSKTDVDEPEQTPDTAERLPRFETVPEVLVSEGLTGMLKCDQDFRFIDSTGRVWHAKKGTLTDGASVPQLFLSFIGDKFAPEYRAAALVHDAYCGGENEGGPHYHDAAWEDVHLMFYEALLENRRVVAEKTGKPVDSTLGDVEAKLMFSAVWLGGPRWEMSNNQPKAKAMKATKKSFTAKPIAKKVQEEEFEKCEKWIKAKDPSIEKIVEWMGNREPAVQAGQSPPLKID